MNITGKQINLKATYTNVFNSVFRLRFSTITKFEIYIGVESSQKVFWDDLFRDFQILPFDSTVSENAVEIHKKLKKLNKLIAIPDLFIAATAVTHSLACATLNKEHFERIKDLTVIK